MIVMTISAPTVAPCGKPTMSGEPSGLRVSDWKTAPETPSAPPTSTAHSTRGRRTSLMMNSEPASPPPEQRADHGAGRDRELAGADGEDRQREHDRGQDQPSTTDRWWTRSETESRTAEGRVAALTAGRSACGARAR